MATAVELADYVRRTGTLTIPSGEGFKVKIRVVDARAIFGRTELRVTPIAGSGETWATVQSVALDPKEAE